MGKSRFLLCGWLLSVSLAQAAIDPALLKPLASEDSDTKIAAITALAQAAPAEALPVLKALADDSLAVAGSASSSLPASGFSTRPITPRSRRRRQRAR